MFFLLLFSQAISTSLQNPLGEIFLRPNEIYTDNILTYFSGEGQNFSVFFESPSPVIFFNNETKLFPTSFYSTPGGNNSASTRFPIWFQNNSNKFIFYNDTNLWVYQLSPTSGTIDLMREYSILEVLIEGKIIQVVKTRSWVIILVAKVEIIKCLICPEVYKSPEFYEFESFEILFFNLNLDNLRKSEGSWDFKYHDFVTLGHSQLDCLAVGVISEYYHKGGFIIIYEMDDPVLLKIVQLIHTYYLFINDSFVENKPMPIDLVIQGGSLLIMNHPNFIATFIYDYDNGTFVENGVNNMTNFGVLQRFGVIYENSLENELLPVITEKTIIIYGINYNSNEFALINNHSSENLTLSQSIYPYFFSSYTSGDDLIFCIFMIFSYHSELIFQVSLKSLMPDLSFPCPWLVVPDFNEKYYLMIQDVSGVNLLSLSIASFYFQVKSENSSIVKFCGKNAKSEVCSDLTINITNSTGPLILNRYRNLTGTDIEVYFYTEKVFIAFYAENYMIGSNIHYIFDNASDEYFSFYTQEYDVLTRLPKITSYNEYVNGGYYGFDYYLIDNFGFVYVNFTLLNDFPDALDLNAKNHISKEIVILYPGFLLFYSGFIENSTILLLPDNCLYLRIVDELVMCASQNNLFLITSFTSFSQYSIINETIIDFTITQSPYFNFFYVFVLTKNSIITFELNDQELVKVNQLYVEAHRVFAYSRMVCILGVEYFSVYDLMMTMQIKQIKIDPNYLSVKMVINILSLQYDKQILVYDIEAPEIGENPLTISTSDCLMSGYQFNFYLLLCPFTIELIRTTCPPTCLSPSIVYFTLSNISSVNQGNYEMKVPVMIKSKSSQVTLDLTFQIFTYAAATFFDPESYPKTLGIAYNEQSSVSLEYLINGYNLNSTLLINNQRVNLSDPSEILTSPVIMIDRVTKTNEFKSSETILDFVIVEQSDLVLVLTIEKLLVFDKIQGFNFSHVKNLSPSYFFYVTEIFNGTCQYIQQVSRTNDHCLFVSICSEYFLYEDYYDGQVLQVNESSTNIVLFQYDLVNHTIDLSLSCEISYNVSFVQVINADIKHFLIVIGTPRIGVRNNYLYLYKGVWFHPGAYFLTLYNCIDFYSLMLPKFFAHSVSGIYQQPTELYTQEIIVLYAADAYFGIRVLQVNNLEVFIIQNVTFYEDTPTSVSVCGKLLFVTTSKTYFVTFLIEDLYLQLYNTHPASPLDEFLGISSSISCSNYYFPSYNSYLLKNSTSSSHYKLRIISWKSTFNSSVMSDIDIYCTDCLIKKTKSLFLNDSFLIYLNNNNLAMSVLFLSPATLLFPVMSKKNYSNMIKKYSKNEFEMVIQLQHLGNTINSSPIILIRSGPQRFQSNSKNKNIFNYYYLLIPGVFIPLIIFITVLAYKKIFKKKSKTIPIDMHPRVVKLQMFKSNLQKYSGIKNLNTR